MNDTLINQITEILNKGKLSHAIMIDSGEEDERLQVAKHIAQALVCTATEKPCNQCSHCKKALSASHPDIALYEGGTTPSSFKVDYVREISRDASVLPNEAEKKVYILNRADTMSVSAQNALLKILEEPPRYVSFILLTPSKSSMLPTILSRVTVYSLTSDNNAVNENIIKANQIAKNILDAIIQNNEYALLELTSDFDKNSIKLCCNELYKICSEALVSKFTDIASNVDEFDVSLSANKLIQITETCNDIIDAANANMNNTLLISLLCSKLIS